ncbi:MAG: hypothetical protein HQM06_13505 [Magnetococcales bacterium]|nr:hypothetical protein [Magnetococcales bacterium]
MDQAKGTVNREAQDLIQHRQAEEIPIKDADTFFARLSELLHALEAYNRPHPLSKELAVATMKRYLSKPEYRIQLSDLIEEEVQRVLQAIEKANLLDCNAPVTQEEANRRMRVVMVCRSMREMGMAASSLG